MTDPDAAEAADVPPALPAEDTEDAEDAVPSGRGRPGRRQVLLRLDPAVHDALAAWAAGELRSTNAQIEFLLRRALADAGRFPSGVRPIPRRGRPPRSEPPPDAT